MLTTIGRFNGASEEREMRSGSSYIIFTCLQCGREENEKYRVLEIV